MKKQRNMREILFVVELFANISCFGFYRKPSSGHLIMLCSTF